MYTTMRKLLALILCVMMFVSVIPTVAFADGIIDDPLETVNQYNREIKNMIKNTRESIEDAYAVLTMDKVVYNSAKGMDDVIVNLVDGIAKPLVEKGKMTKAESDIVKNAVRGLFDGIVADKMTANAYKYTDGTSIDPLKYAQVFADSVNSALTSAKFQKGYEAVATYFALGQIVKDVNDKLDKEYDKFHDSIDMKFDAKFADRYPELATFFVDSLTEAVPYQVYNAFILAAIDAAIESGDIDMIPIFEESLIEIDPWAARVDAEVGSPY